MKRAAIIILAALALTPAASAFAQENAPASLDAFAWMDGRWRGPATTATQNGPVTFTQTERSGEMLDGAIRVIEGKGYNADGSVGFNAFAVIAANPDGTYSMHSWAQGREGTFPIAVDGNSYSWSTPAGPATIQYRATIDGEKWVEVGHLLREGQQPVEIFRMELTRVDDTNWPAAGVLGKE